MIRSKAGTGGGKMMSTWDKYVSGKSAAWTAIFTGVLVVFTGILALVAFRANQNFVITQRAFVNFNNITGTKVLTADGKNIKGINFLVSWTNSGTTPTNKAISQVNVQPWQSELPKGFDFADLATVERIAHRNWSKGNCRSDYRSTY